MADVVDLRTRAPVTHENEFNSQLVQDLARFSEGLATEKDIRRRYQFDDATWESLNNDALISAVEDEKQSESDPVLLRENVRRHW